MKRYCRIQPLATRDSAAAPAENIHPYLEYQLETVWKPYNPEVYLPQQCLEHLDGRLSRKEDEDIPRQLQREDHEGVRHRPVHEACLESLCLDDLHGVPGRQRHVSGALRVVDCKWAGFIGVPSRNFMLHTTSAHVRL